jgi:hypothetical protein
MIRYTLHCDKNHDFESWFQNSAAYDKQAKRSLVTCPICGSAKVEKAIMAPRLAQRSDSLLDHADMTGHQAPTAPNPAPLPPGSAPAILPNGPVAMMSPPERELRQKLKELRDHIFKNASYVGTSFPEEARKIHYGETEHRSIYGEASPDEARELHDEGIEFHPIPILPDDKN